MLLGVSDDETWGKEKIVVSHGGGLLLYTDGVIEAWNETGILYGQERLKTVVSEVIESPADEISSAVLMDLENFFGDEAQSDDIAMIVIKRDEA